VRRCTGTWRTPPRSLSSVTVVTPALNAARFIGATIESVLTQDYESIEYVVVDGGSVDETVSIVRGFGSRVRLITGPDRGQSDAIARGFAATTGEFITYLNADDLLASDAISVLASVLEANPEAPAAYGAAVNIDEVGRAIAPYPTRPFDRGRLARECFIAQPATLMRRSAYDAIGGIDRGLEFAMDYDLWFRLNAESLMVYVDRTLAFSRLHVASKTVARRAEVYNEIFTVLRKNCGFVPYEWTAGYATFLLDHSERIAGMRGRSPLIALLALGVGLWANPRKPVGYLGDWFAYRSHRRAGMRVVAD
jgi:glycosyltransferase involved in cell wall biosynthesis